MSLGPAKKDNKSPKASVIRLLWTRLREWLRTAIAELKAPTALGSDDLLGRWLNQIDKISTSILENYCCDRTHLGRFATKAHSQTFETLEFGCDVSREKGSGWYSGLKPSFLINAGGREAHRLQY